jgi:hypothetical protein
MPNSADGTAKNYQEAVLGKLMFPRYYSYNHTLAACGLGGLPDAFVTVTRDLF